MSAKNLHKLPSCKAKLLRSESIRPRTIRKRNLRSGAGINEYPRLTRPTGSNVGLSCVEMPTSIDFLIIVTQIAALPHRKWKNRLITRGNSFTFLINQRDKMYWNGPAAVTGVAQQLPSGISRGRSNQYHPTQNACY